MSKILNLPIVLLVLSFNIGGICQSQESDFSHIEIIIDSTDFNKIMSDSFIRESLGQTAYDTLQPSPLVLSYFINGLENFIHFNPNKGFFKSQRGSAYLIFQTRRPGQGKLLEQSWKKFTKDSLKLYDYKHPDFTLTEIIFKKHYNLQKSNTSNLIPMLSSYSVESYKKWGLGDSTEVSIKDFIGLDTIKSKKFFTKIESVHLSITQKELTELESMLNVVGYEKKKDKFIKSGQPEIIFAIDNKLNGCKVTELELVLNDSSDTKYLDFGNTSLQIKDNKASFQFR